MRKKEIVDKIADNRGFKRKEVKVIVEDFMNEIKEATARGEKATFVGFGTFEPRERKAKNGTDPSTGAKIEIEAKVIPYFKASKEYREEVTKNLKK